MTRHSNPLQASAARIDNDRWQDAQLTSPRQLADTSAQWRTNDLPSRYYLSHFNEFLEVIKSSYHHTLTQQHLAFLDEFAKLGADAQCLYVRMLNRQGELFDTRKFKYAEINNIPLQLTVLENRGFCRRVELDDLDQWLPQITRAELLELVAAQCASGSFKRSWSKAALLEFARLHLTAKHHTARTLMASFVIQRRSSDIGYLLFLYFGKIEQGLSRFTLRDLGVVRTGSFRKNFQARFDTLDEAQSGWFYCQHLQKVDDADAAVLRELVCRIDEWPVPVGEQARLMRQQLLHRVGQKAEKWADTEFAIQVYRHSDGWPASERLIRLTYAQGEKEAVERQLVRMIDDPSCDDEVLFARDFYERKYKKKRTSRITDMLRDTPIIHLDECFRDTPEQGAMAWFRAQGGTVFFSENRLWKSLFGLVFWPLLFENERAGLHNDFEKRPKDLDNGEFYRRFSIEIEETLAQFENKPAFFKVLLERVTRHYGTANGIFLWRSNLFEVIRAFLDAAPASAVAVMLRKMAKDYANNHAGFPDLLVIKDGKARFVEIKAEGDQLRRNQLKQIVAMQEAGLSVEVNRVGWVFDPNQIYVVIDIETTGRRSASNRITEIAAVKMQGEEVIDEWQSLINPCRSIPPNITQLTGITNHMVSDAPLFQEIADSLEAFTEGAVFVAHNVRFDYGFISDEYRRLDRAFRRPTLCTCVEMRKWFKGLKSYSLANLCAEYEIELDSHHRAMCDAEAAAELLSMINKKRALEKPQEDT